MEEDSGSHVSRQQRFEDVVDFVKQPRVVDDVDCVSTCREAGLKSQK